ncbi:MAG: tryptophan-rich sensory protein, partial [Bacillota bacterium]
TWHYFYFGIGVVIMLLLLVLLIGMYNVINQVKDKPLDRLPFSLYLGWISVATIANISYYLTEIGWNGFGISDEIWTVALLVIAFILATWFRYSQSDIVYPLVFIWALIGVGIKNQGVSELVSITSFIVSGLLVIVILFVRKKKHTLSFSR